MQYTDSYTLLMHIPIFKPIGDENSEHYILFLLCSLVSDQDKRVCRARITLLCSGLCAVFPPQITNYNSQILHIDICMLFCVQIVNQKLTLMASTLFVNSSTPSS